MAEALTDVRLEVARWYIVEFRAALPHAQVEFTWPGDAVGLDAIWLDELTGDISYPVMGPGRQIRDDTFDVPFIMQVARATGDEAADALKVLMAGAQDVLAEHPTLRDEVPGVIVARQGTTRAALGKTPADGARGFGYLTATVEARLT